MRDDPNSSADGAPPARAGTTEGARTGLDPRTGGPRSLDGVSSFMGLRWEDPQTVRLQIRPELINGGGLLSGVATYAMVDYCMGSTLWAQTTREERIATINISINYIQTATEGEIVCRTSSTGATARSRYAQRGPPRGRAAARDGDRQLHDLLRARCAGAAAAAPRRALSERR